MQMSKVHVVDTVEVTLDSYDFEEFCKLWNKGEIVDTHRNHYQYKFYTDINKARKLLDLFSEEEQMSREIKFQSGLPDDIDKRVEKIQKRLEELNPEIWQMVEDLENIGWELEDIYKDLWEGSNNVIQAKKYELESITSFSNWLKRFRIDPHRQSTWVDTEFDSGCYRIL